jgi:hypothetical protein
MRDESVGRTPIQRCEPAAVQRGDARHFVARRASTREEVPENCPLYLASYDLGDLWLLWLKTVDFCPAM